MSKKNKRVWGFLGKESPCIPMLVTEIDGKFRVTVESTGVEVPCLSEYMQYEYHAPDEDTEYVKSWWKMVFGSKKMAQMFRSCEIARCCEKYEVRIEASLDQISEDREAIQNLKVLESIL
jgi:hypothetical protein